MTGINKTFQNMSFTDYLGHFSRIKKTFVLQDEQTLKTQVVQYEAQVINDQVDLQPLLQNHLKDIKNLSLKVYNFKINQYVQFQTRDSVFNIPRMILEGSPHVVLVKFSQYVSETMSMNSVDSKLNQEDKQEVCSKSQRSKERLLLEVIQIVKKWRGLHETRKGKAMTLPEAAQILGLPKKSLDDYYYQLRMGEKYGFDFHGHMMDGIGVLRSFLKKFKNVRRNQKSQKLPTCLRIAGEIDHYQNLLKPVSREEKTDKMEQEKEEQIVEEHSKKQSIEKTFYNEFNYDFGKENDPFLNLGKSRSGRDQLNMDLSSSSNFDLFF